jgi:hypothetical protein
MGVRAEIAHLAVCARNDYLRGWSTLLDGLFDVTLRHAASYAEFKNLKEVIICGLTKPSTGVRN